VAEPLRYPADRVCIVLLTGLGDVINGLPLVNLLKAHDPSRRITWVVEPMPSGVLRHHPAIDEVIVYHKRRGAAGVRDLWRTMRRHRFDLTLNLNIYFKSVWPTLFSRAPNRLGFGPDRARDGVWLAANHHIAPGPRVHTVDLFLEFAEHLGIQQREVRYDLRLTEEECREQREFFAPLRDRPVVAMVPASANARKDWLPERYAEVATALERDFGFHVVLVGGPGERETAIATEIVERSGASPVWGLGDGVRRLLWLIGGSDLVISPDTGPLHIARALDVPVIGLYGHTNPWRAGPYRRYQDLWVDRYTDPGAAPDPTVFGPRHGRMQQITVDDVLERAQRAVTRYIGGGGAPSAGPG
jgi:heptosyltransferase I